MNDSSQQTPIILNSHIYSISTMERRASIDSNNAESNLINEQKPIASTVVPQGKFAKFVEALRRIFELYSPIFDKVLEFVQNKFSSYGKNVSGLITAWFGVFLKACGILSFSNLIPAFISRLALTLFPSFIIAIATSHLFVAILLAFAINYLSVDIVLPLAALSYLTSPAAAISHLGIFGMASALSFGVTLGSISSWIKGYYSSSVCYDIEELEFMGENLFAQAESILPIIAHETAEHVGVVSAKIYAFLPSFESISNNFTANVKNFIGYKTEEPIREFRAESPTPVVPRSIFS